jgi:phosphoribosylaminoimidazole-succinocarboxamide synthase
MKKSERFDTPLITPSIKEATGHDEPVSEDEILRHPGSLREEVSQRYIEAFETITGEIFSEESLDFEAERHMVWSYIAGPDGPKRKEQTWLS